MALLALRAKLFPHLNYGLALQNGSGDAFGDHQVAEFYSKNKLQLNEISRELNANLGANSASGAPEHTKKQAGDVQRQGMDVAFRDILTAFRQQVESGGHGALVVQSTEMTLITNLQSDDDIRALAAQLGCLAEMNVVDQQGVIRRFHSQEGGTNGSLIPQTLLWHYIQCAVSPDEQNIKHVARCRRLCTWCEMLTLHMLAQKNVLQSINHCLARLDVLQRQETQLALVQFLLETKDSMETKRCVGNLATSLSIDHELFLQQFRGLGSIRNIHALQCLVRDAVVFALGEAGLDSPDYKRTQWVCETLGCLHPSQQVLGQVLAVAKDQDSDLYKGSTKLCRYYSSLLSPNIKPYENDYYNTMLLLVLFLTSRTLEQRISLYQLFEERVMLRKRCNICGNYYKTKCISCSGAVYLDGSLEVVKSAQHLIVFSYSDRKEQHDVLELLKEVFPQGQQAQKVSILQQQQDYSPLVFFKIFQIMDYQTEMVNFCFSSYQGANQNGKKYIINYLVSSSFHLSQNGLARFQFVYLLDEQNEQINQYVLGQLYQVCYINKQLVYLERDQLLYFILYFCYQFKQLFKNTNNMRVILYLVFLNIDVIAFNTDLAQVCLNLLNLVVLYDKNALSSHIENIWQHLNAGDPAQYRTIEFFGTDARTNNWANKYNMMMMFYTLVFDKAAVSSAFVSDLICYTLLAIVNSQIPRQVRSACKNMVQYCIQVLPVSGDPQQICFSNILKISLGQNNRYVVRNVLQIMVARGTQVNADLSSVLLLCLRVEDPGILYYSSLLLSRCGDAKIDQIKSKVQSCFERDMLRCQSVQPDFIIQYSANSCVKIQSIGSEQIYQQAVYYGMNNGIRFYNLREIGNRPEEAEGAADPPSPEPAGLFKQMQENVTSPEFFASTLQISPVAIGGAQNKVQIYNDEQCCCLSKYLVFLLLDDNKIFNVRMQRNLLCVALKYSFGEVIARSLELVRGEQEYTYQNRAVLSIRDYNCRTSDLSLFCNMLAQAVKAQLLENKPQIQNLLYNVVVQQRLLDTVIHLTANSLIAPQDSVFFAVYFLFLSSASGYKSVQLLSLCKQRFKVMNMFKQSVNLITRPIELLQRVDLTCYFNIQQVFRLFCDTREEFQTLLKNLAAVLLERDQGAEGTIFVKYFEYITCFLPFDMFQDSVSWYCDLIGEYDALSDFRQQVLDVYAGQRRAKLDIIMELASEVARCK